MSKQKSFAADHSLGCLYLVATPIGNLEDMTFRAIRILKEADYIAAEDTRHTRKLLTHFDISNRLMSYHEHNKQTSGADLIGLLLEGKSVALVSDAGMPAISDPGQELVKQAVAEGIPIIPVPGANAALSALIVSGLATDTFLFLGFLPRNKKELQACLDEYKDTKATIIVYEAPHRLIRTMEQLFESWGDRPIVLARELTKKHEEMFRGSLQQALQHLEEQAPRGEYVVVIEQSWEEGAGQEEEAWWVRLTVQAHVAAYEARGVSRKEALKLAAIDRGLPKRVLYNELELDKKRSLHSNMRQQGDKEI